MGCFDSVYFDCPNCGEKMEAQSKGGECQFYTYPADAVPAEVAIDLCIWNRCKCGKAYRIKPIAPALVKVEIEEAETTEGEDCRARWESLKS